MKRQNRGWLSRYGIWNTPQKVVDFVKEHGQLHETWFDLFFDLIFVAFALKMGNLVKQDLNIENIVFSFGLFATLWMTHSQLSTFMSMYHTSGLLNKTMLLLQSMVTFEMVIHTSCTSENIAQNQIMGLLLSLAMSRLLLALSYCSIHKHAGDSKKHVKIMCAIFIFTAAVALSTLLAIKLMDVHEASITESEGRSLAATTSLVTVDCSGKTPSGEMVDGVMILVIGLFVGVGVEMISMLVVPMMVTDRIAIHSDMLRERQSAFVMLILGESVIQLALPNVSGLAFEHESAALSGFTLVFSMALMYFDVKQQQGHFHEENEEHLLLREQKETITAFLWILYHLFLTFSLLCVGIGLKSLFTNIGKTTPKKYLWLLCVSLCMTELLFVFIRLSIKGFPSTTRRMVAYIFRAVFALASLGIPLLTLHPLPSLAILALFAVAQVCFDSYASVRALMKRRAAKDAGGLLMADITPVKIAVDASTADMSEEKRVSDQQQRARPKSPNPMIQALKRENSSLRETIQLLKRAAAAKSSSPKN